MLRQTLVSLSLVLCLLSIAGCSTTTACKPQADNLGVYLEPTPAPIVETKAMSCATLYEVAIAFKRGLTSCNDDKEDAYNVYKADRSLPTGD